MKVVEIANLLEQRAFVAIAFLLFPILKNLLIPNLVFPMMQLISQTRSKFLRVAVVMEALSPFLNLRNFVSERQSHRHRSSIPGRHDKRSSSGKNRRRVIRRYRPQDDEEFHRFGHLWGRRENVQG